MRILFLHTTKKIPGWIKKDKYHVKLALNEGYILGNRKKNKKETNKNLIYHDEMKNGCLIGMILIGDDSDWYDKKKHGNTKWATGPFVYTIKDTFKFVNPIYVQGKQGLWYLTRSELRLVLKQDGVISCLSKWIHTCNIFIKSFKSISCISICQPFATLILLRIKNIENRKSGFISILTSKKKKCFNRTNNKKICRLCADDKEGDCYCNKK